MPCNPPNQLGMQRDLIYSINRITTFNYRFLSLRTRLGRVRAMRCAATSRPVPVRPSRLPDHDPNL